MLNPICFKVIEIDWIKPLKIVDNVFIDEIIVENLKEELSEIKSQHLLYQIYGFSPIYGNNSLLYIGKTIRPPENRIIEHSLSKFSRVLNMTIVIGEVEFFDNSVNYLEIAESILITLTKPSYNSKNIDNILQIAKDDNYLIINKNNRGVLPLECSNIWWNYDKYVIKSHE